MHFGLILACEKHLSLIIPSHKKNTLRFLKVLKFFDLSSQITYHMWGPCSADTVKQD